MASGKTSPECPDEKTALTAADPERDAGRDAGQDAGQQCGAVAEHGGSKLTLYHWTQSFNSQKVSVPLRFSTAGQGTAPRPRSELRPAHICLQLFTDVPLHLLPAQDIPLHRPGSAATVLSVLYNIYMLQPINLCIFHLYITGPLQVLIYYLYSASLLSV